MLSVGIDVSKGKSTICMMKPFGEIVAEPMEISHIGPELKTLVNLIKSMNDDVKSLWKPQVCIIFPCLHT